MNGNTLRSRSVLTGSGLKPAIAFLCLLSTCATAWSAVAPLPTAPLDGSIAPKTSDEKTGELAAPSTPSAPTVSVETKLKEARQLWEQGQAAIGSDLKRSYFSRGAQAAREAREIDPATADAPYLLALNLNGLIRNSGISELMSRRIELTQALQQTLAKKMRDGRDGSENDDFAGDRMMGKLLYQLPASAGGSRERSLEHLNRAYTKAPESAANILALSEVLADGSELDRARARQMLSDLRLKKGESEARASELLKDLGGPVNTANGVTNPGATGSAVPTGASAI